MATVAIVLCNGNEGLAKFGGKHSVSRGSSVAIGMFSASVALSHFIFFPTPSVFETIIIAMCK